MADPASDLVGKKNEQSPPVFGNASVVVLLQTMLELVINIDMLIWNYFALEKGTYK